MKRTHRARQQALARAAAALAMTVALFATPAWAAPRFGHGEAGEFGLPEIWSFDGPGTLPSGDFMNEPGDQFSQRITVLSTSTVDRVWQRLVGATGDDATFTVGIMADDGTGKPTGDYLMADDMLGPAIATHVNPINSVAFESVFSGSITLTPGVYHVVTTLVDIGPDEAFHFRGSNASNIYGYDRSLDTNLAVLTRDTSGSWVEHANHPYLGIGDSAGPNPNISQQVYGQRLFTVALTSSTQSYGQRFMITDAEAPAGAVVLVDQLDIAVFTTGGQFEAPLLIHLRESDGTILATMTVANADAQTTAMNTLFFDPVFLKQGQEYLLTTELGGDSGNYWLPVVSSSIPNGGNAGWGGTDFAHIIRSSNKWTTWVDNSPTRDLQFTLRGTVYTPEPASGLLLAAGGVAWLRRRRA